MKCRYSEKVLALYVEGDVSNAQRLKLENHFRVCRDCREAVTELRESQSIFKSLRRDTVSETELASMRQSVLAQVAGAETLSAWGMRIERWLLAGFRRRYALAGLAFAAVVSGIMWQSMRPSGPQRELAPVAVTAPALALTPTPSPAPREELPAAAAPEAVRPAPKPQPAADSPVQEERKQIVVKLLTDDPNIVIYWLLDQNGGGE